MDKGVSKTQKKKTIRSQVLSGYLILTCILILLIFISILSLNIIKRGNETLISYQEQKGQAQEVIAAHYKWLEQLSDAITTGEPFKGSIDPDTCALGKWISSTQAELNSDSVMKQALDGIIEPHKAIHLTAEELITLSQTDKTEAYKVYGTDYKPKVESIGEGLTKISARYGERSADLESQLKRMELLAMILLVIVGAVAAAISIIIGRRVAKRISVPIITVEKWSEEMAAGVYDLNFSSDDFDKSHTAEEIDRMVTSFQRMADSIHENVQVIKRVAEGDLTAFVDIRSEGDSLGQNLYHLVQNNDFMFGKILKVADSVAGSAEHIASASQSLAESSSSQAAAVGILSTTVELANTLAAKNAEESLTAADCIGAMKEEVRIGQEKMYTLAHAVQDIYEASQQISAVMKSINDISFQTNILALNAAVEAARAGTVGKGFAVVADEVRQLSFKSKEAAEQTRVLIENTIKKTTEGSRISKEASTTFDSIVNSAEQIFTVMEDINTASKNQQSYIEEIYEEISKISASVSQNAAYSEETAASTREMNTNAEYIRSEMKRFNLRKREPGKPYIPVEKMDDEEFIKKAYANYKEAHSSPQAPREP